MRATIALVVLSVATFCYVTTELLPVGLLTQIADDLGLSHSATGLLVTAYAAAVVLASIPLTRLTQRVPRRWLLAATLGVFSGATLFSAFASSFAGLLAGRLLTGVTQGLFWSVITPAATSLFPPPVRGRVIARMAIGTSLAPVLGVPAATWLGQQAGWRTPFVVMAAVGLAAALAVLALMPTIAPAEAATARGSAPDLGRFLNLTLVVILGVTGFFTAYTYITPFLVDVGGFRESTLSVLLLVAGAAGLCGTLFVGTVLERHPRATLLVPLGLISLWLTGLYLSGPVQVAAVGLLILLCFTFSALPPAFSSRTLQVAPGSTDLASAGISSAFNIGIAAGSFLGGLLVAGPGPRGVALAGALLVAAALGVMLAESRMARSVVH